MWTKESRYNFYLGEIILQYRSFVINLNLDTAIKFYTIVKYLILTNIIVVELQIDH